MKVFVYMYIYIHGIYLTHTYTSIYIYTRHISHTHIHICMYIYICTLQRSFVCGAGKPEALSGRPPPDHPLSCARRCRSLHPSFDRQNKWCKTNILNDQVVRRFRFSISMSLYVQTSQDNLLSLFFDVLTHVIAGVLISHLIGS